MRTPTIFIPHGDYEGYLSRTFGLRGFLEFRNAFTTTGAEASPIYTGITIARSGAGTRVLTSGGMTTTQVISYSQSHTFDRVLFTDLALDFDSATQFSDGSYDETFPTASLADDESLFKHYVFGINRTERFLSDPKRHYLYLTGSKGFTGFKYGTQVINANPPTDLIKGFTISCPFFDYADPFSTLPNEYDQWNCSIGVDPETSVFGTDVTGYSATKWRDLRGTYTLTKNDSDIDPSWTTNSVVHTTQWTIF
jgi:hypothetical protein